MPDDDDPSITERWTYPTLIAAFDAEEEGKRERILFIPQHVDKISYEEALAITPIEVWDRFADQPDLVRVLGADLERYEVYNRPEGLVIVWRLPFQSTDPFSF